MSHIRVNGLEGHYTIKRLKKLPKRGNSNWLYTLKKDNLSVFYLWTLDNEYEKISISDSLSFATKIEAGDNIFITGTGTDLDPYIINAIAETAVETPVTPVGNIESTNVQDALEELQADIDIISVQSDWDQTDNTQPDFIQNKPTNTSEFANDGSDGTSLYVEENNPILPRIVSGLVDNSTAIATFIRDDSSNFSVDFSTLLGGDIIIDDTLSNTSTNALENQEIENNFQIVSQNLSEQMRYRAPGRGIRYYVHGNLISNNNVSSVPFATPVVWFGANGNRYMAVEDVNFNSLFFQAFFENSGGLVQAMFTRASTIFGTNIEYEQRIAYNTLSTTPDTSLINVPSNYTVFEVQASYTLNYMLGIGNVTFTDSPFISFSWVKQAPVSGSGIQSVVAGTNIDVDNTDPVNPIISSTSIEQTSGVFSPVLSSSFGSETYTFSVQEANYQKTGNLVFFNIFLSGISGFTGTPSGVLRIEGLPFNALHSTGINVNRFDIGYSDPIDVEGFLPQSTSNINFILKSTSIGVTAGFTIGGAGQIIINGTYITND